MSILSKSCPRRRDWERSQGPSLITSMPRRLPPVAHGVPRKDASCQRHNRSNWALSLCCTTTGRKMNSQHGILNYHTFLKGGRSYRKFTLFPSPRKRIFVYLPFEDICFFTVQERSTRPYQSSSAPPVCAKTPPPSPCGSRRLEGIR